MRSLDEELGLGLPAWRLGLDALARRLSGDVALEWLSRLTLQRGDAERIAEAVAVGPKLVSA